MKVLFLFAFVAIVSADVSHILQEDGYHYEAPSKPFPIQPVVDIPLPAPVILPKPTNIEPQYLPPPQAEIQVASRGSAIESIPLVQVPHPTPAQIVIPQLQPTNPLPVIVRPVAPVAPVAPVRDYLPPTPAPVVHTAPSVQIVQRLSENVVELDQSASQSLSVAQKGYFYDNNPQPPFSF